MTLEAILSFIEQLEFIKNRGAEEKALVVTEIDKENNIIKGKLFVRICDGEEEIVEFSCKVGNTQEVLRINSLYKLDLNRAVTSFQEPYTQHMVKTEGEWVEQTDSFSIVSDEKEHFFRPKYKQIYHIENQELKEIYQVDRDYNFSKGFSEDFRRVDLEQPVQKKFKWKRRGMRQS